MSLSGCSWQAIDLRPAEQTALVSRNLRGLQLTNGEANAHAIRMRNTYTQYRRADKQFACHGTTHKGGRWQSRIRHSTAQNTHRATATAAAAKAKAKAAKNIEKPIRKQLETAMPATAMHGGGSDCQFELRYSCNFLEYTINKEQDKTLSQKSLKSCWSNN